jgi:hypothetical protein
MNARFFYPLVILLYLASAWFAYEYVSYYRLTEDEARIEASIMSTNSASSPARETEIAVVEQEKQNLQFESYGYLAGALFLVLCPTLLLIFRQRVLN